jgi:hypothetical protein
MANNIPVKAEGDITHAAQGHDAVLLHHAITRHVGALPSVAWVIS